MKNKKKRKGFTLIELLAVIIVLAIIALIATPIIFNVIENAKIKSLENSCYGVIDAVRTKYAEGLLNLNKITNGNVNELTVSGEKPIDGTWTIDNSKDSEQRGIKIDNVRFSSMKDYACSNDLETGKVSCKKTYKDNSSANTPILFKNMVPIKYENNKWIIADLGQKWYDYDAKEWANAVVLNSGVTKNVGDEVTEEEISLWYVWIPRYKYTIFNVIENAKIKSLENSCYGVIDAVRTNYSENLLNSTRECKDENDKNCGGKIETNGDVEELTVAGEQPSGGSWVIVNDPKAENGRGIQITDVTFDSMKGYFCSNDLTTGKVKCEKDDANPTLEPIQATVEIGMGTDKSIEEYFTFAKTGRGASTLSCKEGNTQITNVSALALGDHQVKCIATKTSNGKTSAEKQVTIKVVEKPLVLKDAIL